MYLGEILMSDFSKLDLLIDSKQALNELNKVQKGLNKTQSAAKSLTSTLKNIGVAVGFTALIKQTLQLEASTDALNRRFNTFFGNGKKLTNSLQDNYALANRNAKQLLSTAAKFGSATNLDSSNLTKFSSDLAKLAADVAAFQGIDDVNSVLQRFGVATLGRTQGLREFGVQIDTTSQSFKNQIKIIQETTGATEAQAKQTLILNEAMKQLVYTQGAAKDLAGGWANLQILFSNIKDILAETGKAFTTLFGPILKFINKILNADISKQFIGWGIALTTVGIAFNKILSVYDNLTKKLITEKLESLGANIDLQKSQQRYNNLKARQLKIQQQINNLKAQQLSQRIVNKDINLDKTSKGGIFKAYSISADFEDKEITKTQESIKKLGEELKPIHSELDEISSSVSGFSPALTSLIPGFNLLAEGFKRFLLVSSASTTTINASTSALLMHNLVQKTSIALTKARAIVDAAYNGVIKGIIGSIGMIKNFIMGIIGLGGGISGIYAIIKALIVKSGTFLALLGKILIIVGAIIAVVDGLNVLYQLIFNKNHEVDWDKTITGKIVNWFYEVDEGVAERIASFNKALNELKKGKEQYNNIIQDYKTKKLPIGDQIKALQNQLDASSSSLSKYRKQLKYNQEQLSRHKDVSINKTVTTADGRVILEAQHYTEKVNAAQLKVNEQLKKNLEIRNKIEQLEKKRNEINLEYSKKLVDIDSNLRTALSQFEYGYLKKAIPGIGKAGQFGNFDELNKQELLYQQRLAITNRLQILAKKKDLASLITRSQLLQQYFDNIKQTDKLDLSILAKQRQARIDELKGMMNLAKEAGKFKQTAQQGIQATSMKAYQMQNRRLGELTGDQLNPMIQQQRAIRQIQTKMLEVQKQSKADLTNISRSMRNVTQKIGKGNGASNLNLITAI